MYELVSKTKNYDDDTRLKSILDELQYMIWIKDENGRFKFVNKAYEQACGKKYEDIIGSNDFDVWENELAIQYVADDIQIMKSGKESVLEELIKSDSRDIWYETFRTPTYDLLGNLTGIVGTSKDISKRKGLEIALENQKRFLKSMIDTIPDLIFYKDIDNRYLGCNKGFAQNFIGLSEDDIIGKTNADLLMDKKLIEISMENDRKVIENGQSIFVEEKIELSNGNIIDIETSKTPLYDDKGKIAGLIGSSRDITSRKNVEKQLSAQREYAEMLLNTVPSAVYSLDNAKNVTSWNKRAEAITGYTPEEVLGKKCNIFECDPCLESCLKDILNKPVIDLTCSIKSKNGEIKYVSMNIDMLRNDKGEIIGRIECFDDITEKLYMEEELRQKNKSLEIAYRKLEKIATTDSLTKLLNRREMLNKLDYARIRFERNTTPFSIIISDIDCFKNINDSYGHDFGDYVLVNISSIMKKNLRKQDFVARWGGEEFLILLPDTDEHGAEILAEKLRQKIQDHIFSFKAISVKSTMTFGVSAYNGENTIDEVISKADNALYRGKNSGKNRVESSANNTHV